MDFKSLYTNLTDTQSFPGIIALGVLLLVISSLACLVSTVILTRPGGLLGKIKEKFDVTLFRYFIRIKNIMIFTAAIAVYSNFVPGLKNLFAPLMASAGAMALIGGFAAKSTIANFVAGLSIAFYRPIKIGDRVEFDGEFCTIEEITLRHTIARTLQSTRILIPNSKLDEMTLVNYSIIDQKVLCTLKLGVSYDTDIDLATRVILEEATVCPQRDIKAVQPMVRVISHEDFSIGLRLYLWVSAPDDLRLARFWLLERIKKRFDKEGIEIPFPYRTIVYKSDLPEPVREPES